MRKRAAVMTAALALLLMTGLPALSQDSTADKAQKPAAVELSEARAKQTAETVFAQFVDAYNKHDAKAAAALFSLDTEAAMVSDQAGVQKASGRDLLQGVISSNFEQNKEDRISAHSVLSAHFASPGAVVAVVGTDRKSSPTAETRKDRFALILEKRGATWQIAVLRLYPNVAVSPAPTSPAPTSPSP